MDSICFLDGFDDPVLDGALWRRLLERGETDTIFLTCWWQKAWWKIFGRGRLLLVGFFQSGELVGIAPLFVDSGGMIYFTGSGGSDYLDFIGIVPNYVELLEFVIEEVPEFIGFRFYHVPDKSGTGASLRSAAKYLDLICCDEGSIPAPKIDLRAVGTGVLKKKSLLRHQRFFEREGDLSILHIDPACEILPRLPAFFNQHIARWEKTSYPSLFLESKHRLFYETLVRSADATSGLRFTEICWNKAPIAFHFGFSYSGTYMWYKPSFDVELAKRSPGEVLIRSLLIAAIAEGDAVFDFGLGSETFKERFATHTAVVRTWGLYPAGRVIDKDKFGRD